MKFLGCCSAALVALPFVNSHFRKEATKKTVGAIRIQPIPGKTYSPSFLRFCQRARFSSVNEAVKRVRDRNIEYRVIAESV
ncbi:MAG: hypothetical protein ACR2H1_08670 [Limisphaerales bacterium]